MTTGEVMKRQKITTTMDIRTIDCLKEAFLKAVNLGDDTDTVAAITGGLTGLFCGYETIPDNWRRSK